MLVAQTAASRLVFCTPMLAVEETVAHMLDAVNKAADGKERGN